MPFDAKKMASKDLPRHFFGGEGVSHLGKYLKLVVLQSKHQIRILHQILISFRHWSTSASTKLKKLHAFKKSTLAPFFFDHLPPPPSCPPLMTKTSIIIVFRYIIRFFTLRGTFLMYQTFLLEIYIHFNPFPENPPQIRRS